MKRTNTSRVHTNTKIIISVIIIILIILLLLTSCTSNFWGKVGDFFGGSSDYEIKENTGNRKILTNKNLIFDSKDSSMFLDNTFYKISFSAKDIKPDKYTCSTSKAEIATCVAKDGYVEITPRKSGNVIVYIQAETNGFIYRGTHNLEIKDPLKSLDLSQKKGTINLAYNKSLVVNINANNLSLDGAIVSVDKSKIAEAKIRNNSLIIKALNTGKTKISISLKVGNEEYKVAFDLTVIKEIKTTTTKKTTTTTTKKTTTTKRTTTSTTTTTQILSSESKLKDIVVSTSSLKPNFNPNKTSYEVLVDETINKISITATAMDKKAKLSYRVNNKTVSNLNNISLVTGNNSVEIIVTAENGSRSIYTINVIKEASGNADLKDLNVDNHLIGPTFNKDVLEYNLEVGYKTTQIKVNVAVADNKATTKFYLNNVEVKNLNNVSLKEGENIIKIVVTAENSKEKIYTLKVIRNYRKINFAVNKASFYIEDAPHNLVYNILESNVEIDDYELSDIKVTTTNLNGTAKLEKGFITIIPKITDLNKEITVEMSYGSSHTTMIISIKTRDYYLEVFSNEYDINLENDQGYKNIILNTNILSKKASDIKVSNLTNGIKITSNNSDVLLDQEAFINVVLSDPSMASLEFIKNENSNSYAIKVNAKKAGVVNIIINGSIYGNAQKEIAIKINIIKKYNIEIDANGGFFDAFTTNYQFLLTEKETIDLSEYVSSKVDTSGNCLFYSLESFNTLPDGSGIHYDKDQVLTNFTNDLKLYAIYSKTSHYEELVEESRLYLTDVDLFHNEEYYEQYNVDKVIYPDAYGYHIIKIKNNGTGPINIKKINLEEDTICLTEGCINMGYIIKHSKSMDDHYTYYYGSQKAYEVLNKDSKTTHSYGALTGYHTENNIDISPAITIPIGEETEISLLWRWVDTDSILDTKIGDMVSNDNNSYTITVSIDFERTSTYCKLN